MIQIHIEVISTEKGELLYVKDLMSLEQFKKEVKNIEKIVNKKVKETDEEDNGTRTEV